MQECGDNGQGCAAEYPSQAEKRTMIEHLRDEAERRDVLTEDLRARLKQVDARLQRVLHEGDFIMDDILTSAYPPEKFWWMYGYIAEKR